MLFSVNKKGVKQVKGGVCSPIRVIQISPH